MKGSTLRLPPTPAGQVGSGPRRATANKFAVNKKIDKKFLVDIENISFNLREEHLFTTEQMFILSD
ncbi:hypothetical protein [Fodinibius sediminis]|uniref:hypothetical protein n=1 Tax=Fodinibius sediminis TaxID=1214077 RepID=UPI0011576816|nr:hypothetical protein [Fodinibius sediminis]